MFICYFCSVTQCVTCILQDSAENFHYSNQGQDVRISGTDDVVELERTRNAFTILGKLKNIYLFLQNNIHFLQNLWFTLAGVQPDQQMGIFCNTGSYSLSREYQHTSQRSGWGPQLLWWTSTISYYFAHFWVTFDVCLIWCRTGAVLIS